MKVMAGHVWLPLGRTGQGRNLYVPFSVPEMTVWARGVLHAAKPTLNRDNPRRKTIDTICGKRAYPVIVNVDESHAIVPIWPMPVRFGLGGRCPDCTVGAERKKPDVMYRGMDLTAQTNVRAEAP